MTTMTPPTRRVTTNAAHDTDWRFGAPCGQADPELFFPIGYSKEARDQEKQAKRICGTCPVAETCLQWALATRQDSGVWGGLSEDERRRIHRRTRPTYRGGGKTAVDNILDNRREEFLELAGAGRNVAEISRELGTNALTVQRVRDALEADGQLEAAA